MITARGTRAAAPVRWIGAVVLAGAGGSGLCVATGSGGGVGVCAGICAADVSDPSGASGAQPAVSSATTSSTATPTAGCLARPARVVAPCPANHSARAFTDTGLHGPSHSAANRTYSRVRHSGVRGCAVAGLFRYLRVSYISRFCTCDLGRTVIDFPTTRDLAAHVGLKIDKSDPRGENFAYEADWGIYRGSGFGLRGSRDSGWLVTFAARSPYSPTGFLVAHALQSEEACVNDFSAADADPPINVDTPSFGGRCLLLGGPWDRDLEERILSTASEQEWFEPAAGGASVDVEMLDLWLKNTGHGVQ